MLAVWDIFDVARQSARQRRKMIEEHFSDEKFLREIRDKVAEKKAASERNEESP